jgi:hypothetical protein
LVGNWTTNGIVAPDMYRAGRVPRDRNNVRVALAVEIDDWGAEIALEASGDHLLDKSAAAKIVPDRDTPLAAMLRHDQIDVAVAN